MPLVEGNDFNELINNKPFLDQPIKNKKCKKFFSKCHKAITTQ